MLAIENEVNKANEQFSTVEDLKAYARENRHAQVSDRYLSLKQFSDEEAEALAEGKQYGPVLKNNVWTMSRVLDTKMAPDSIGVRHLAVPYTETELADSLATQLRAGVAFAEVGEGAGEERVYPFAAFTEEFIPALSTAKVGDVVEITAGNAIHIMQIYRMDKPSKHIRSVTVNYPVEASAATKRDIHGKAGILAVDGAGSIEKFNAAATAAAVTPRVATINQGERVIRGLENSRDIVRWAAGAEKGDISEIFNVGGDYVVAMLTEVDDQEFASFEKRQAQIRNIPCIGAGEEDIADRDLGIQV
jgi:peptidyl-prolyl cis-trans isomerase D